MHRTHWMNSFSSHRVVPGEVIRLVPRGLLTSESNRVQLEQEPFDDEI